MEFWALGLTTLHPVIKRKSNPRSVEHCFSLPGNAGTCTCTLWIKFKRWNINHIIIHCLGAIIPCRWTHLFSILTTQVCYERIKQVLSSLVGPCFVMSSFLRMIGGKWHANTWPRPQRRLDWEERHTHLVQTTCVTYLVVCGKCVSELQRIIPLYYSVYYLLYDIIQLHR